MATLMIRALSTTIPDGNELQFGGSDYNKSTFTCTGPCNSSNNDAFHHDGYLKSGELKRLINITPSLENFAFPDSIRIFKNSFSGKCFLKKNEAQKIFYIVRQNLSYLEFPQRLPKSNVNNIRREICNFLNHVTQCLFRCTITESAKTSNIEDMVIHLGKLVRHTGCFNDLKDDDLTNYFSVNRTGDHSAYHHFLHLSLDVRWTYLAAAHLYEISNRRNGNSQRPIDYDNIAANSFTRCLRDVVLDLVALSIKRFNKIRTGDYIQESPFACNCVRELWVMVVRLTDFREEIGLSDSFWVNLRRLVFDFILKEGTLPSSFPNSDSADVAAVTLPSNPIGFCWWLLTHLSTLYHINIDGNYCKGLTTQVRSNYFELCNLLKLSLTPEVGEWSLRTYLRCCSVMCNSWEPSTDVAFILWDHFFKRLGETFMIPGQIDSCGIQSKSIGTWLDNVKWRSVADRYVVETPESSYQIFLGILGPLITACQKFGAEQEWKQLKGRILSKFHPRKMQEFSVLALSNAMDLFLTLAASANLEEMTQKMLGVIEMLDSCTLNTTNRQVIWKSLFVLTLLHVEKCLDVSLPARKLASDCEQLMNNISRNAVSRADTDFTALITVYLDGTLEVFEMSRNFVRNEHLLLVPDLSKLLHNFNVPEYFTMLSFLQSLLWKLQTLSKESSITVIKSQCQCVADVIWTSFVPVIKDVAVKSLSYETLADVASTLVFLVKDLPPTSSSATKESLASLFNYFSTCTVSRPDFCCRFIRNVLSCEDTQSHVVSDVPDYQENIIRIWILCAIQINNDNIRDLGRIVFEFPEVLRVFGEAEILMATGDKSVIEFFKALGAMAVKKSDFRELIAFKNKVNTYVGEMSKIVSAVLKNSTSTEQIKNLYHVVGHFVKYCALCAYTKAKSDCEFCAVISNMILPRVIYDDSKEIPASVLASIQDSLHLFVSGLSRLEIRKDPFVARTLRDIIIYYLPRFTQQGNSSLTVLIHPLIVCLKDAIDASPEENTKELLTYTVEVVRSHYLTRQQSKTESIPRYLMGLTFLRDTISRCCNVDRANLCVKLLRPLLDIVLDAEPNTAVNSIATEALQSLLKAANTHCDVDSKMSLKVIVRNFLSHYVVSQSEKAFKTMEVVAAVIPYLVAEMLSDIAIVVNQAQQAKGSGVNENLRKSHERFVRHVGRRFSLTGEPKESSAISG